MWPLLGATALLAVLGLLLIGELAFERARRRPKAPKRLPPPR